MTRITMIIKGERLPGVCELPISELQGLALLFCGHLQ